MTMRAVDLHAHSTFSLLDGMGSPKAVVERAKELRWPAAALTEHGSLMSATMFYKACRENGIKPILGCELYVVADVGVKEKNQKNYHLTALALSKEGYENLVVWSTFANQRENFHYKPRISPDMMAELAPHPLHHNVILSGCLGSELCQMLLNGNGLAVDLGAEYIRAMKYLFPNFYIEVQHHYSPRFFENEALVEYHSLCLSETIVQSKLIELAYATSTPLILTNDSHFQSQDQREAHLAMRASQWRSRDDSHYGQSIERLKQEYVRDYAYWTNYMQPMEKIVERKFPDFCADEALEASRAIVEESNILLDPLDRFSYSIPFSGFDKPLKEIRLRAKARLSQLVERHGSDAIKRFEDELSAMGNFAHYLLLMSDFIIYARRQGILTNTRGSAANSIVCYCLEIHNIDSIHYGLRFERFYNPSRKKLPDIDVDIEKDRFEDFMEYVKAVMEEREGEGQVVQICNYGTLANRAAFRLIADTLGISKGKQDEISKLLPQMIDSGMVEEVDDVYQAMKEQYPDLYDLVSTMFDSIRQVSQHACGWLFGTRERPIEEWIPLCLIASSGTLVTQYDYKTVEEFGLVKGDFLRLKTLSVIQRTLKLVGMDALDLEKIPLDDPKTFEMLRQGKTEGIFTLQGKANRAGCMECEVATVHDVIASVAIYRPALMRSDYHFVYNRRRRGREDVTFPAELAAEILGPTYGIPIFQEQILDLGYALGMGHREVEEFLGAIKLAKGVGRHAKAAFEAIRPMYDKHALEILTKEEAEGVWEIIDSFKGYGFNKGHATSYGILAVRAAWLKANYPRHFYSALLDVYPEKMRYIASARGEGYRLMGPDVNLSGVGFTLGSKENEIRVGLSRIKGLGPVAWRAIVEGQPYSSVADFRERIPARSVNVTRMQALIDVGAFKSVGVEGDGLDSTQFLNLGFVLKRPEALRGIKPKHVRPWTSQGGHRFLGLHRGIDITEGRASVAKLFWIAPLPDKEIIEKKASPWAKVNMVLLKVVDENGIPFHVMASEDNEADVKLLEFLAKHCQGAGICLNGRIKQPFLLDGPMGFGFYGVAGVKEAEAQIWNFSHMRTKDLLRAWSDSQRIQRQKKERNES